MRILLSKNFKLDRFAQEVDTFDFGFHRIVFLFS